jgi:hypothetical protein
MNPEARYVPGKDLLVLHPFRDIPIVTPAQFLESFRPEAGEGP